MADRADLERLLAAWRESPDPALEQQIIELGAALDRTRISIKNRSADKLEVAWHA